MRRTAFRRSRAWRVALVLSTAGFLGTVGFAARTSPRQNQQTQNSGQQDQARGQQNQNFDNVDIHVLPVQGNVYMLVGAGGNITLQVGDEGVLLVDTQFAQLSDRILAAIRKLSTKPIRYIINTHVHPDHIGGNENIAKAGSTIAGGNVVGTIGASASQGATVIAHENVLNRMSAPTGQQAPMPIGAWPTDTFFTLEKEVFFNGEAIQILHQPAAHTDGDSIVFFRRSDVVSTGDIFVTTSYPIIDTQRGGSIQGIVDALNRVLDLTIPKEKQEGGTMVIPGHGRLCDEADVVEYRDMVTIIRDRIQDMLKKRMTLAQVQAARPTLDYDGRYGATTGSWTTEMFVEAVYRDLSQGRLSQAR
jgi:glyoxylase-like metal-dependent hydrolase (beta-lactamase superfamily II)